MAIRADRETIRGFICNDVPESPGKNAVEGDDDGDDLEEDDFMEMEDIKAAIGGAFPSKSMNVRKKTVKFLKENTKNPISITGTFLFTDPWWNIEVDILKSKSRVKKVVHTPRYRVKDMWDVRDVTQYLQSCRIPMDKCGTAVTLIKRAYKKNDQFAVAEISNLGNNLRDTFQSGRPMLLTGEEKAVLEMLVNYIWCSGLPTIIDRALSYPKLFWTLQSILPKKAFSILCGGAGPAGEKSDGAWSSNAPNLAALNIAIEESPWDFCFSYVLQDRYNLCSCEVSLADFNKTAACVDHPGLDDAMKHHLAVYDKLKSYCLRNGHTFQNWPQIPQHSPMKRKRSETVRYLGRDNVRAARMEPRESNQDGQPAFYLRRYWDAEKNIAEHLINIAVGETSLELPELDKEDWTNLDEFQQKAIDNIRTKPLTVVSGMGGCGKTMVISKLVKKYSQTVENQQEELESSLNESFIGKVVGLQRDRSGDGSILLTAPTGKAASLLGKKCGLPSFTIHSVIYSHMAWKIGLKKIMDPKEGFPWSFAETRMLVVDECSMVSVTIFERLLKILLADTSIEKVVLVGDIRQLPSVEPGNFFEDVFEVARKHNFSVDLKTNHRVDPGGQIIVENARMISRKVMPEFDEVVRNQPDSFDTGSRFRFLEVSGANENVVQARMLDRLCALLENWDGLKDDTSSQIISFKRSVVREINAHCCNHYNQHYPYHKNRRDFRPGDKICCKKNCVVKNPKYQPTSDTGRTIRNVNNTGNAQKPADQELPKFNTDQAIELFFNGAAKSECQNNYGAMPQTSASEQVAGTSHGHFGMTVGRVIREEEDVSGKEHRTSSTNGVAADNSPITNDENSVDRDAGHTGANEGHTGDTENTEYREYRMSNGDTFKIKQMASVEEDGKKTEHALLDNMEGESYWVDFKSFCRDGKVEHAWCRTIHTFQGSEIKTVVYLLSCSSAETWKHVYTAVTRGREQVVIIGKRSHLEEAIQREHNRNTGLRWFFEKALCKRPIDQVDLQSPAKLPKQ